jgi:cysteinyl-tRNA synthetase
MPVRRSPRPTGTDAEAGYHPLAFRLFLLGSHYRSQLDFSTTAMDAAQAALRRLARRTEPLRPLPEASTFAAALALAGEDAAAARLIGDIDEAIASDLATPRVLAIVQDALRDPELTAPGRRAVIAAGNALQGLGLDTLQASDLDSQRAADGLTAGDRQAIEDLVAERSAAREQRDWARADEIRAVLERRGAAVTDTPSGPVWELR